MESDLRVSPTPTLQLGHDALMKFSQMLNAAGGSSRIFLSSQDELILQFLSESCELNRIYWSRYMPDGSVKQTLRGDVANGSAKEVITRLICLLSLEI